MAVAKTRTTSLAKASLVVRIQRVRLQEHYEIRFEFQQWLSHCWRSFETDRHPNFKGDISRRRRRYRCSTRVFVRGDFRLLPRRQTILFYRHLGLLKDVTNSPRFQRCTAQKLEGIFNVTWHNDILRLLSADSTFVPWMRRAKHFFDTLRHPK